MVHVNFMTDPIIALALRVARRADELARETGAGEPDLGPWLRAEEEILGQRLPAPALPAAAGASGSGEPVGADASR